MSRLSKQFLSLPGAIYAYQRPADFGHCILATADTSRIHLHQRFPCAPGCYNRKMERLDDDWKIRPKVTVLLKTAVNEFLQGYYLEHPDSRSLVQNAKELASGYRGLDVQIALSTACAYVLPLKPTHGMNAPRTAAIAIDVCPVPKSPVVSARFIADAVKTGASSNDMYSIWYKPDDHGDLPVLVVQDGVIDAIVCQPGWLV